MITTTQEAAKEIADRIIGCFGSVDLLFAIHGPDTVTAKELKKIACTWHLDRATIEAAIEHRIREWLETKYWKFGAQEPGPCADSPLVRNLKIVAMVNEAASYLTNQ